MVIWYIVYKTETYTFSESFHSFEDAYRELLTRIPSNCDIVIQRWNINDDDKNLGYPISNDAILKANETEIKFNEFI